MSTLTEAYEAVLKLPQIKTPLLIEHQIEGIDYCKYQTDCMAAATTKDKERCYKLKSCFALRTLKWRLN